MDRFDVIFKRKSIRQYQDNEVDGVKLLEIWNLIESVERLFPEIDLEILMEVEGINIRKIMGGVIGNYGQIMAPHYLVITSEEKEGYLENVGYVVENLVLGMTVMGINTCWIGGQVKKEFIHDFMEIQENHKIVMILSFGYAADQTQQFRKSTDRVKRKSVSDLVIEGEPKNLWKNILEAVRFAPSAVNNQPWRFAFTDQGVHIYGVKRNFMAKWIYKQLNWVDVGIALSHIKIAAEHYGMHLEFEKIPQAKRKGYNYVMSVVEK